jgi:serine/threonine-protein kinase
MEQSGPQQIGRYKILGELGKGAMGVVYQAQDPAIGRLIAIKSIRLDALTEESERARMRDRLFREAQSAGILSHPGIVTIYDIAEEKGMAYIFMEFVNGPSLEKLLKQEQAPDKETLLSILRQTAAALDYAHKKGIIHRDIKPANIMIHEDGSSKITDFGVAKIVSQQMTAAGTIMGTPSYMSPEQVQGVNVSGQTDQFALAVIAYEMLTGEKPFTAEYMPTLLYKIVREDPPPPHRLNRTISADVDQVIKKGLAKLGADRYETCVDFVHALRAALNNSPNWVPLPSGAGGGLSTAGSQTNLSDQLETMSETMAAPVPTAPPIAAPLMATAFAGAVDHVSAEEEGSSANPAPAGTTPSPEPEPDRKPEPEPDPNLPHAAGTASKAAPAHPANAPISSATIPELPPRAAARRPMEAESKKPGGALRKAVLAAALVAAVGVGFFVVRQKPASPPEPAPAPTVGAEPADMAGGAPPSGVAVPPPGPEPLPASNGVSPAATPSSNPVATGKAAPAPTEASFTLTTTPAGAEGVIDGNGDQKCTSPCSVVLSLGRHTLVVRKDGYRDVQRIFVLPNDPGLILNLEQLTGTLMMMSNPPGLTIVIDGQEQTRKTPANITLPVGQHRVQILKGSEKQEFAVDIRDGVISQKSIEWGN